MKIAISGTYSSGKTTTSMALANMTGIPRTHAKAMREILPEVLPGKRLEDCTAPELFQLGMIRYGERAVHESHLQDGFISDGSSLHEWVYGKIRTRVGIHPDNHAASMVETSAEMKYFSEVIEAIGAVTKRHAKKTYDVFVHLPIEFDLVTDGHRPVSERFRQLSDDLLLSSLEELAIPYHVIGGTVAERLTGIAKALNLPQLMDVERAIALAYDEAAGTNTADELNR